MISVKNIVKRANLEPGHFQPHIILEIKRNYGTDHSYIVSEHKEAVETLTGKKTVTSRDIEALKALGFTVYSRTERKAL